MCLDDRVADFRISRGRVMRVSQSSVRRGVVELAELPDRALVRLLRRDFSLVGLNPAQPKGYRRRGPRSARAEDSGGPVFG